MLRKISTSFNLANLSRTESYTKLGAFVAPRFLLTALLSLLNRIPKS
ncbi:hypothetical protein BN1224_CV14_A_02020 [Chlamydia pneumoniae]|uniref:Uncharacterized protein n=1 Tax=Chlamydia pneumoniae TaxID=83558 RepID=A0A0F7WS00_CHLPN|nr:hypothetical protein BN1224_Wien1_A_02010 [Chlamydia pneumoniae]CRI35556.1 hypothetical protein BN1224_CM1_A_02030 [Chlamydia pneumoniae]CRI36683.1 hypothetical protein BN1224_CV14_A_02020 [Chlamydia pneumoniae]CRI37807.1 hypothetical protein BN1224_CV15_B_01300 [Chlamydia pneumoniae]CRI38940.1 hypothetical protein BN1224_CWL011_A_02040 [Chlamydia pneumoniae]